MRTRAATAWAASSTRAPSRAPPTVTRGSDDLVLEHVNAGANAQTHPGRRRREQTTAAAADPTERPDAWPHPSRQTAPRDTDPSSSPPRATRRHLPRLTIEPANSPNAMAAGMPDRIRRATSTTSRRPSRRPSRGRSPAAQRCPRRPRTSRKQAVRASTAATPSPSRPGSRAAPAVSGSWDRPRRRPRRLQVSTPSREQPARPMGAPGAGIDGALRWVLAAGQVGVVPRAEDCRILPPDRGRPIAPHSVIPRMVVRISECRSRRRRRDLAADRPGWSGAALLHRRAR